MNEMMNVDSIGNDKDVVSLKTNIAILEKDAGDLAVQDQESEGMASSMRSQIKGIEKQLKARMDYFTVPAKEWVKGVSNLFKMHMDRLGKIDDMIESKQIAFHEKIEEEKRRIEEANQKKIQKAVEKGKPIPVMPTVQVDNFTRTESGGTAYTKAWTFEILKEEDIPREFCKPDPALINRAIKEGRREISGIRIFEETRTIRK